ncbi:hypothetical protein DKAM_1124 [Desulfurococcus amylolyticus 1221n]|uniref:LSM domain-containing protein n=1 Tax=Desulfurococcus amylolyticus (strain DSM 18924 / JCM 16383 / VKM B-2413 / 1221n) TaxID=490899 RepID=B8D5R9_DESA1|nr:hypothetical protein [Desulfurococcus amylolyticus]ACL11450.1 hypothetical protein DKAM_1124 [Desulfurococcus amylolyticus 1221n]
MKSRNSRAGEREARFEDLDQELLGREVEVVLYDGKAVQGVLAAVSKYWVRLDFEKRQIYLNKKFIVFIRPAK